MHPQLLPTDGETVADIQIVETEAVLKSGHLLFRVNYAAAERDVELQVAIQDQGSLPLNEAAVLRSSLGMAEALEAAIQLRLSAGGHGLGRQSEPMK